RVRVTAATLVLLALVAGMIGTTVGLLEANRQRRLADDRLMEANEQRAIAGERLIEATTQRGLAVSGRKEAEKRLAQKDKANEILMSIFQDLNPRRGDKETLPLSARLGKRLDAATAALEGEATDDPLAVAHLQVALANSQHDLGNAEKAIVLL